MARVRLKDILLNPLKYGANESGVEFDENLPRYIRITDITEEGLLKDDNKLSLDINEYLLEDDDVLLARSGATVGKSFLYKKKYGRATYAGYLIKASFHRKYCLAKYFYYYTLSNYYDEWKNKNIIQATIQNLSAEKYNYLQFPLPDLPTQQRIADYLDKQIELIDKKISLLAQKIEKYKLLKKSVINQAVCGEGKDWKWVRVKDVAFSNIEAGKRPMDQPEEVVSIGGEHIQDGAFFLDNLKYISFKTYETSNGKIQNDDILIVKDGATIGKCMYVINKPYEKMLLNEHVYRLASTRKCYNKFLYYCLMNRGQEWFRRCNMTTAQETIKLDTMYNFSFKMPDIAEQTEIANYLDEKTSKIDSIVDNLQKQIEKYKMLKKAVIDKAVGGEEK